MTLCKHLKDACDKCPVSIKCVQRESIVSDVKVRTLTDIQKVVEHYKDRLGVDKNDKQWDKKYFARHSAAARQLLDLFGETEKVLLAIDVVYKNIGVKGMWWNLNTVIKWAERVEVVIQDELDKKQKRKKAALARKKEQQEYEEAKKNAVPMPEEYKKKFKELMKGSSL